MNITAATFQKVLADTMRGAAARQSRIQQLVVFGVEYAEANDNNFLYVSLLAQRMAEVKGLSIAKLIGYVKNVCAVSYEKARDGKMIFKPLPEAKREGRPVIDRSKLAIAWYDHEKQAKKADLKTVDQLVSYLEKWSKADADAITEEARALCTAMLRTATQFKLERAIQDVAKAA